MSDRERLTCEEISDWLSGNIAAAIERRMENKPARQHYHAFLQGMHAGHQGASYKRDCPYQTIDYRMWWMHGCIAGDSQRELRAELNTMFDGYKQARADLEALEALLRRTTQHLPRHLFPGLRADIDAALGEKTG